ncbi:MAG: hypothetical protein Q9162_002468 [Coniocarpon cinnabarinum]
MSLGLLLQDVVEQLEKAAGFRFITYTPPGLFGPEDASQLAWRPATYIDSITEPSTASDIYASLLPNMAFQRRGQYGIDDSQALPIRLTSKEILGSVADVELACVNDGSNPLDLLMEAIPAWHHNVDSLMFAVMPDDEARGGTLKLECELMNKIYTQQFDQAGDLARRLKEKPGEDAYSAVRRIVGCAICLPADVVENKQLRLMMRTLSGNRPLQLGLTWRTIEPALVPNSYPVRYHVHNDEIKETCTGDQRCEDDDVPPIIYEAEDVEQKDSRVERHVFGVWAPTTVLSWSTVSETLSTQDRKSIAEGLKRKISSSTSIMKKSGTPVLELPSLDEQEAERGTLDTKDDILREE